MENGVLDKVAKAAERHSLSFAYVFGSMAEDTAGPLSDIDIGVEADWGEDDERARAKADKLYDELCEAFRGTEVNVVLLRQAPWQLQFDAISRGKLAFCRDRERHGAYVESVLRHWHDFSWSVDKFHAEVADEIHRGGFLAER